ncbi:MAG: WD40 repeat domain-containing protein [Armatimonadota bacterium]
MNWILGAVGMAWCGLFALVNLFDADDFPGRTVEHLTFTADGRTVAGNGSVIRSGGLRQGEVYGWDAATGRRLWTEVISGTTDVPSALMPDGRTLVIIVPVRTGLQRWIPSLASTDSCRYSLTFRNARTGRLLSEALPSPNLGEFTPLSIDVAPDGRSVAAAFSDCVVVWSAIAGTPEPAWFPRTLLKPDAPLSLPIRSAHFSADSLHLVVDSAESDYDSRREAWIDLWNTRTGTRIHAFRNTLQRGEPPTDFPHDMVAFSPDRKRMVTFHEKGARFALWDMATGKRLAEAHAEGMPASERCYNLRFFRPETTAENESEAVLVTVTRYMHTRQRYTSSSYATLFWDVKASPVWRKTLGKSDRQDEDAISPDGRLAASITGWQDNRLAILTDAHTGREIGVLEGDGGL